MIIWELREEIYVIKEKMYTEIKTIFLLEKENASNSSDNRIYYV